MQSENLSPEPDHVVAYLVADDAPAVDWLEDMGVVAIDENGVWKLTAWARRQWHASTGSTARQRPCPACSVGVGGSASLVPGGLA